MHVSMNIHAMHEKAVLHLQDVRSRQLTAAGLEQRGETVGYTGSFIFNDPKHFLSWSMAVAVSLQACRECIMSPAGVQLCIVLDNSSIEFAWILY